MSMEESILYHCKLIEDKKKELDKELRDYYEQFKTICRVSGTEYTDEQIKLLVEKMGE